MNRFVTGVADLVEEQCRTTMLHSDMNISRLMVYAKSNEESKLSRISMNLKRGGSNDKFQPRFKKRDHNQDGPSAPKVKFERGSGSQCDKPTCITCGKKYLGKFLAGNNGCFSCCEDGHKVKDFPSIVVRGKDTKKDPPSVQDDDAPRKNRFYALRAKGTSPDDDDDVGTLYFSRKLL
ncbi:uncharacterized protein [Solanum lycopersicum]|uniref:uncharacterized protein n=1 Tax=Solanum lycopersicum TaxID=4081 RepID=UPI000532AF9D|nr:uncharacterized protein LOC104648773 [Solanum lycopersicum]